MYALNAAVNGPSLIGDAVVVIILLLAAFFGARRGFIGVIVKFLAGILTIVLATALAAPAANFLGNTCGLRAPIEAFIADSVVPESAVFSTPVNLLTPEMVEEALAGLKLPSFVCSAIAKLALSSESLASVSESLGALVTAKVATVCLQAIAWVILFIIFGIIFMILKRFVRIFNRIPLVGVANKLLGALLELLVAFAIICIIMHIFVLVSVFLPEAVVGYVQGSPILGFLYNHNPVAALLSAIFK